ncbi:MAG: hypothetical protein IH946_06620, partial [Bacteroidetes bacterium]|nr:hypothetical protein [Bacteroidota bacterium]
MSHQNPGSILSQRLASYSAIASAILVAGNTASAAVQYTDVNPDTTLNLDGQQFFLDLNNDNVIDFRFDLNTLNTGGMIRNNVNLTPYGNNGFYNTFSSTTFFGQTQTGYPAAVFEMNEAIGGGGTQWGTAPEFIGGFGVKSSQTFTFGVWPGQSDKYLGLYIIVGGQKHYGWLRMDMAADVSWITIKDYAYEDVPCQRIITGLMFSTKVDSVNNIMIADTNDTGNGQDLFVTFDKALNESIISGYRAYVVKSPMAGVFNALTVCGIPDSLSTFIPPTGANPQVMLGPNAKDVEGDPVSNGVPYKVFIVTVADGLNASLDGFQGPSNEVTLLAPANPASNVVITDVSDMGDGRDMRVSYDKAVNEANVDFYRIIAVKAADAPGFDLTAANAVTSNNYTIMPTLGTNVTTLLGSNATDKDGQPIANGIAYKAFILAVAYGGAPAGNALSLESNELILGLTTDPVSNVQVQDIFDNANGADLQVSFNKVIDENTIVDKYRAIAVRSDTASSFTIDEANQLVSGRYID